MNNLSSAGVRQAWCGDQYELEYASTAVFRGENVIKMTVLSQGPFKDIVHENDASLQSLGWMTLSETDGRYRVAMAKANGSAVICRYLRFNTIRISVMTEVLRFVYNSSIGWVCHL
jgi:hypothetical protein